MQPASPRGAPERDATPAPQRRSRRAGWALRVVASAALVLLAASWLSPYLSLRAENAARPRRARATPATALGQVQRAERLNPLAVSPLVTQAMLLQHLGRNGEALETLRRAETSAADYEVWYELGVLQHGVLDRDGGQGVLRPRPRSESFRSRRRYELEQAVRRCPPAGGAGRQADPWW